MSSPSEFLTFYRRIATNASFRTRFTSLPTQRTFSAASIRFSSGGKLSTDDSVATDGYPDGEHATRKTDQLDVQSDNSAKGRDAKSNDKGGSATQEADSNNSTAKAKKEHPEAPDVVIGMQDERGGKGH